jgi:hypothetical protein
MRTNGSCLLSSFCTFSILPLFIACSDGDDLPKDSDGISSTGCDAITLAPPEKGVQLALPISLQVGQEAEFCQLVKVDQALNISWSDALYTNGSHHGLVHKTSYNGDFPTNTIDGLPFDGDPSKPHRCLTPGALWDTQGVIAGGRSIAHRDDPTANPLRRGVLPDNVALRVEPGDILLVNFHMINPTTKDLDACYKANLYSIDDEQADVEAGVFFLYNPFITLRPTSSGTARMACPVTQDATLLSAVSHMHSRGVGSQAHLWDKSPALADAVPIMRFYDEPKWEEPAAVQFDTPVSLTTGQWIDWSCDYVNSESRSVAQGLATTDEMCMFVGLYYPKSLELERCGQNGFRDGIMFGNGTKNGADFLSCLQAQQVTLFGAFDDPNRYATLSCFTQTCAKASPPLVPFLACASRNNGALTGCEAELAAVQAATCD